MESAFEAPAPEDSASAAAPPEPEAPEDTGPSEEDLAAYLGARGAVPSKEEADTLPFQDGELPSLEEAERRIPIKTKALMEELFRAKLEKVQRVNPKKIR